MKKEASEPKPAHTPLATQQGARRARTLRKESTPPERFLWRWLRNRSLDGLKFRRQHPMGPYVIDFFCDEAKLVVEVDGDVHASRKQRDAMRDRWMAERGLLTLRFTVSELMMNLEGVIIVIQREARARIELRNDPHPCPLPQGEGAIPPRSAASSPSSGSSSLSA